MYLCGPHVYIIFVISFQHNNTVLTIVKGGYCRLTLSLLAVKVLLYFKPNNWARLPEHHRQHRHLKAFEKKPKIF